MDQVTLKNASNNPVIVGDKYLFPGETRTVSAGIAERAMAKNEGALEFKAASGELTVEIDDEQPDADDKQVKEVVNDSEADAAGGAAKKRGSRSKPNTE